MRLPPVSNVFIKIRGIHADSAGDPALLRELLYNIAARLNLRVLDEKLHQFEPRGVTGVLLLSESHIAVHSWPEHGYAIVELLTCKPFGAAEQALLSSELNNALGAVTLEITVNR
jgi:S-adenosylmethionine decarboxylase